ncbi:MAG: LuxR C-terminal-related transcriptional regulator [Bacteroidota bacterium]
MCKSGVKGYLLKDANPKEITKAISMILNNEDYYTPRVQNILATAFRDFDKTLPAFNHEHQITKAQTCVLKLLCKQYSSEEIATELNISVPTVHRHRQDLLDRTESINLAGLVIYALEHGLISFNMK